MDIDDDLPTTSTETGSDDLLSDDNLRLPENASPLVRLHAVRAWLKRRQRETSLEIGEAALALQHLQLANEPATRLRRRELQELSERTQQAQQKYEAAQLLLQAYEEASELLEDCVNHTTVGERLLVEYYLTLDEIVQHGFQEQADRQSPRIQAMADVQHRVEHVGMPGDEE